MEMSSTNSRIVTTSYISNNTDIRINDVKREIYLTSSVGLNNLHQLILNVM